MEEIPLPSNTSPDTTSFFKRIFEGAQGVIIKLPAVPTGDVLQPNQIGFYGTDIYIRTSTGTKIKLTGSSWS